MKQYISEARAVFEDYYHGMFSKKLAEWAISKMRIKDPATKEMRQLQPRTIEEMKEVLLNNGVQLPNEYVYTAWYLYNMSFADYPKALTNNTQRAHFVEETLCDPDCCPEAVLECFVAKMCTMGVPIYWEEYL